jgi:hypothetical protein
MRQSILPKDGNLRAGSDTRAVPEPHVVRGAERGDGERPSTGESTTTAHYGVQPHSMSPACFGGHFTVPYEQNTQQSSAFGFNSTPQLVHS